MDQILIYWWFFVALIVSVVDETFDWLRPHGFSSGMFLFAILTAGLFTGFNKWSVGVDLRIQAIEKKLGIEHQPRRETKKITWWAPLLWSFSHCLPDGQIDQRGQLGVLCWNSSVRLYVVNVCFRRLLLC